MDPIDIDQNSYVCEAMEEVSISSPSFTSKVKGTAVMISSEEPSSHTAPITMPSQNRPKKPIPPPLVLRDDVSMINNSLLTEFAMIATSPRSPLMQKHLPIRKRAYSYSSMENLQSYEKPQPLTPPFGLLSPPSSHVSYSSLNSSIEEIQNRISPMSPVDTDKDNQSMEMQTNAHQWPIAIWQCFLNGVRVQILGGEPTWIPVEELKKKAENNNELSQYAPNGLCLLDAYNYPKSDTSPTLIRLRFSPVDPVPYQQPTVLVEFTSDHPFFVKDKGWSSVHPDLTAKTYGIPCRALQVFDICLPSSHPEATFTTNVYESVKSFDFTPEDTSAVFALSSMAKKQMQNVNVPVVTMSPPISPVKKCPQSSFNGLVTAESPKPKRPMNGFMLFAQKNRIQYTQSHPGKDNRAISVLLGETWKRMKDEERGFYTTEARVMAEKQKQLHPDCWKRRRSLTIAS